MSELEGKCRDRSLNKRVAIRGRSNQMAQSAEARSENLNLMSDVPNFGAPSEVAGPHQSESNMRV